MSLVPSVAFSCLLELPWYPALDSTVGEHVTDLLVQEWSLTGHQPDCLTFARQIEDDLREHAAKVCDELAEETADEVRGYGVKIAQAERRMANEPSPGTAHSLAKNSKTEYERRREGAASRRDLLRAAAERLRERGNAA